MEYNNRRIKPEEWLRVGTAIVIFAVIAGIITETILTRNFPEANELIIRGAGSLVFASVIGIGFGIIKSWDNKLGNT